MANVNEATAAARSLAGSKPFVQVSGLRKRFDGTVALQGVSFDVGLGSTVSLLGPSGCGKTTMLRSIAGLETPDDGRIIIGDTVVFDGKRQVEVAPEKRRIGMVFQSYAVWPHMTVGENVGFPLKIKRTPSREIETRVRDVLSLVGLEGLGSRPATNLSGGQQQRVALARAIVHEPRLVLFDEPLSNLDAKLRHQMRTELKVLQDRLGFTAIYVTHDQEEALALSDEVIVMNHGRVEGMAPPRELFARPTTPFVANFLGFDNMYEGEVVWIGNESSPNFEIVGGAARPIGVTIGGLTLRCFWRNGTPLSRGEPVTLAFRSERVALAPVGGPNDPDTNRHDGIVEACVYLGTCQDYLIKSGSLRVRAVGPGDSTIAPGERVTVSIKPDDCMVFSRDKRQGFDALSEQN